MNFALSVSAESRVTEPDFLRFFPHMCPQAGVQFRGCLLSAQGSQGEGERDRESACTAGEPGLAPHSLGMEPAPDLSQAPWAGRQLLDAQAYGDLPLHPPLSDPRCSAVVYQILVVSRAGSASQQRRLLRSPYLTPQTPLSQLEWDRLPGREE